ncbi:MAG TPA: VWA domain-containing protein [Pyrinomonadaceae bacterium]|jgi:Ca-activated chloride channel family protein
MTLSQPTRPSSQPSPRATPGALASPRFNPLLVSLFLLLSFPANTFAQDTANTDPDEVIRVRTDLIIVPLFVTDAKGLRVSGLVREDFAVSDNGRAVEAEYFAAGTERVALLFALDASGSVRDHLKQQQDAALALFSRFGRGSRVALLQFDERAELVQPFTSVAATNSPAFPASSRTNHRTAIFNAAAFAVHAFNSKGSDPTERRIVILISDGLDTASSTNAADVINQARANAVSFYVIHLPIFAPRDGRLAPRPAAKGFRALAEHTGGRYFMLGDAKSALDPKAGYELAPVFKAIEEDLLGQYVIGYYPGADSRDTGFHQIEVTLTRRSKRKLRLQTLRKGYNLKQ